MAAVTDWIEGARVRTLPAAAAPVLVGAGGAWGEGAFSWPRTLLCLVVALALQVGVNFANDYSDGIRGTDDNRIGPTRMTASGAVKPRVVLTAALASFAVAAVAGLLLVILCGQWWLILAGIAAVIAAWTYTGGKHPYGYLGIAEIFVLTFFGYMATVGTTYVQSLTAPGPVWIAATAMGLLSCALLMVNNLRDIPTDIEAGKRTLAVRLGAPLGRSVFAAYLVFSALAVVLISPNPMWMVAGGAWLALAVWATAGLWRRPTAHTHLVVLRNTGLVTLLAAILLAGCLATTA